MGFVKIRIFDIFDLGGRQGKNGKEAPEEGAYCRDFSVHMDLLFYQNAGIDEQGNTECCAVERVARTIEAYMGLAVVCIVDIWRPFPVITFTASNLHNSLHTPHLKHNSSWITCGWSFSPVIAFEVQLRKQTRQPVHSSGITS